MSISKIDLHIHTVVSDGTDTPQELLQKVKEAGIGLFSVTDHDAIKCSEIIPALLQAGDPAFLPGIEFSCRDEAGKYHILGYGYDPAAAPIRAAVGHGHALRMKKVTARLEFLKKEYGFDFPEEALSCLLSLDNPGKPHIANLMVELGYAENKEQAITQYINKAKIAGPSYLSPQEAIEAILSSGGIPVLAHPFYGDGDQLILGEEMNERLSRLVEFGLRGVEAFYSGFTSRLARQMLAFAERYGFYVTAGSDYHGKNKMIPLGDTGLEEGIQLPDGLKRFIKDAFGADAPAVSAEQERKQ